MEMNKIKEGKIYKLKNGSKLYEEEAFNLRPIVVIKKNRKYVRAVSLDMLPAKAEYEYRVNIEYFNNDNKGMLYSTVFCDIVKDIEYKYIEKEIGYIKDETMGKIMRKVLEKENKDFQQKYIKVENEKAEMLSELMKTLANNDISIKEIANLSNYTKDMMEETRKPINIRKERRIDFIIGFFSGLLSGIIHNWLQNCL